MELPMKKIKKRVSLALYTLLISYSQLAFGIIEFDITTSNIKQEDITHIQKIINNLKSPKKNLDIKLSYNPINHVEYCDPMIPLWVKVTLNKEDNLYNIKEKLQKETINLRHNAQKFLCELKQPSAFDRIN